MSIQKKVTITVATLAVAIIGTLVSLDLVKSREKTREVFQAKEAAWNEAAAAKFPPGFKEDLRDGVSQAQASEKPDSYSPPPQNEVPLPGKATVIPAPQGGNVIVNVYCGDKCPPATAPKKAAKRSRKHHVATRATTRYTAPRYAKPPCPNGECSEYQWNPADRRQPQPGEVSQRIF